MKTKLSPRVIAIIATGAFLVISVVIALVIGSLDTHKQSSVDVQLGQRIEQLGYENTQEQRAAEAAKRGIWGWEDLPEQKAQLLESLPKEDELGFGVVTDFQKNLSAPMTTTQNFVPVTNLTLRDGTTLSMVNLGSLVFLTLEPGASKEEIVMCTGLDTVTVRFTGCTRGLAFAGTSTSAVSANQKTHSSSATVVISNVHYVYQQFLDKNGDTQYVTSTVVFSSFPSVTSSTAVPIFNSQFVNKYYVDNAGISGLTAAAASTSLGLQAFTGLANCSTTGTCIGINASTTASTNGGFLSFAAGTGKLFWDIQSFLTGDVRRFTSLIADTFAGTSTPATLHIVGTPAANTEAANKGYGDYLAFTNQATGTAGMTVAIGSALFVSPTGTLFLADSSVTSSSYGFVGIALTAATANNQVLYVKPGGIAPGTGLKPGKQYYLSTAGALSTSPGSIPARIGVAVSSTALEIQSPSFRARVSGTASLFNGTQSQTVTGFIPTRVELLCQVSAAVWGSSGVWALNSDGTSSTISHGSDDDAVPYEKSSNAAPCQWEEGSTDFLGFVNTTHTGFILTGVGGAARTLYYIAEFDPDFLR